MPKTQPETFIRKSVTDALRASGWYTFYNFQGLGAYKGISDLTAVKDGQTLFVEIKTKTGRQSDYQMQFQKDIEAHGGVYVVARGLKDVEKYLTFKPLF